jgi:homoserine kinase type II
MSVFTKVSYPELQEFLRRYPLGEPLGLQGIGEGVENSNFYVDTEFGRYVLTLFERLNHADLPFFLDLMEHLAERVAAQELEQLGVADLREDGHWGGDPSLRSG